MRGKLVPPATALLAEQYVHRVILSAVVLLKELNS
jgi:hypothetical protein